ncbi:hypothetical protein J4217_01580 [Candidatus Pacearchaeota archaeon]|nr:hypothetical protein [Candidatus Pacearchaeota archaeon]
MSHISISDRGSVKFVTKLKNPYKQALSILEDFPEIRRNAEQSNKGQAAFLLIQEFKANLMLKRIGEAERLLSELDKNPIYEKGCAECYCILGKMYEDKSDHNLAMKYYLKAVQCGPETYHVGRAKSRLSELLVKY